MANDFNTHVAYRDNGSFTTERGAAKFISTMMLTESNGVGDSGGVINGLKVEQASPTSMNVIITAGENNSDAHCIISYDDYCYFGWLTQPYTLRIDGAQQDKSRISYIVAYIDREIVFEEEDNEIESPSVLKFAEVKGTDATNPVPPTSTKIQSIVGPTNPYIILAQISVPSNTSKIVTSLITDKRTYSKIDGDKLGIDSSTFYAAGFEQPGSRTKTSIVVTGPNDSQPAPIEGTELIWIRRKI